VLASFRKEARRRRVGYRPSSTKCWRSKGSVQSGIATVPVDNRHAAFIISYVTRSKRRAWAWTMFHRVTMQVFVRDHFPMIAVPVQCDVDGNWGPLP
jgi:hypothetical protein